MIHTKDNNTTNDLKHILTFAKPRTLERGARRGHKMLDKHSQQHDDFQAPIGFVLDLTLSMSKSIFVSSQMSLFFNSHNINFNSTSGMSFRKSEKK